MKIRARVLAAVRTANRCRQGLGEPAPGTVIGVSGMRRAGDAPERGASPGLRPQPLKAKSTLAGSPDLTEIFWVWVFSFSWYASTS